MYKLSRKTGKQTEFKQFTVTMKKDDVETLAGMAVENDLKFHGYIKAILLGYIDYVKKEENNGQIL